MKEMSMLQQILQDMYVEPELLNELDEEQKQILFCKMREEQLRRWARYEKEYEDRQGRNSESQSRKTGAKTVQWLLDRNGGPWTWVMGEHQDDPSIDEIIEREAQETARILAETEAEELRLGQEEELKEKLRMEGLSNDIGPENTMTSSSEQETVENNVSLSNNDSKTVRFDLPEANSGSGDHAPADWNHLTLTQEGNKEQNSVEVASEPAVNDEVHALLESLRRAKVTVASHRKNEPSTRLFQTSDTDLKKEREALEVKLRMEAERRISEEKERRQSEIYQSLKEAREEANKQAEREQQEEERYWAEQERKSREAEEQVRNIARKAREQHRRQELRTSSSIQMALEHLSHPNSPGTSKGVKLPRPPKPKSRNAIIQWFVKDELPRGTGLDPKTRLIAPWFHGIITREEAESMLKARVWGSFLVRVSERIWGFTLSFSFGKGRVKHFLIERTSEGYQFLGTKQIVHKQLWDLISYHESAPITPQGDEVLRFPVGQNRYLPDYQDLFPASEVSSVSRY